MCNSKKLIKYNLNIALITNSLINAIYKREIILITKSPNL